MPTNGFSVKPLKVKLLAGGQKATESRDRPRMGLPLRVSEACRDQACGTAARRTSIILHEDVAWLGPKILLSCIWGWIKGPNMK